jgi:hypothetical protein
MAVVGLILGIVSLFYNRFLIVSVLAIIFGFIGRSKAKKDPSYKAKGWPPARLFWALSV